MRAVNILSGSVPQIFLRCFVFLVIGNLQCHSQCNVPSDGDVNNGFSIGLSFPAVSLRSRDIALFCRLTGSHICY